MTTPEAATSELKLKIAQIILEGVQFRHVGDYLAIAPDTGSKTDVQAEVSVDVHKQVSKQQAFVRLRISSDVPGAQYSYSISYLILYTYEGTLPQNIDQRLAVTGATMLMPYARELLSNLSTRGRFGPIWLGPVDFNKAIGQMGQASKP